MELKPGEVICDKCNGEGAIHSKDPNGASEQCPKCDGNKKLDWIENIVGLKEDTIFDYMNSLEKFSKLIHPMKQAI